MKRPYTKRALSIILATAITLTMAGCEKNADSGSSGRTTTVSDFAKNLPNGFETGQITNESIGFNNGHIGISVSNESDFESQGMTYTATIVEINALFSSSPVISFAFCNMENYSFTSTELSGGLVGLLKEVMAYEGESLENLMGLSPELATNLAQTLQYEKLESLGLIITGDELQVSEIYFSEETGGFGSAYLQNQDGIDYYQIDYRSEPQDSSSWLIGWHEGMIEYSQNVVGEVAEALVKASGDTLPDGAASPSETAPAQELAADGVTFRDENGQVILNSTCIESVNTVNSDGENYAVLFTFTDEGTDILAAKTAEMIGQTLLLYINESAFYSAQLMDSIVNGEMTLGGTLTKEEADLMTESVMARIEAEK